MDEELAGIINAIYAAINAAMHETENACKTTFAQTADNVVYPAYDDVRCTEGYVRRGSGSYGGTTGIANPDTYEVQYGDLEMTIISNLVGNPMYNDSDGWDPGNITEIIESGTGYHWVSRGRIPGACIKRHYEDAGNPLARPWMDKAGDEFADNALMPMIDIALSNLLGG